MEYIIISYIVVGVLLATLFCVGAVRKSSSDGDKTGVLGVAGLWLVSVLFVGALWPLIALFWLIKKVVK